MCVEKLKFQQQILKYFDVFQWGRKKSWRRSCPYCFPGTTVKRAASSKSPNLQTWEMWANMFHTKICNHNCWSEVAGPIHRGVEKPQKPTNLQPHLCAFGQIQKKLHFCNTCACCCCLSKKKFFLLSAIPLQSEIRERLHNNLVSVLIQVIRWKCYLSQKHDPSVLGIDVIELKAIFFLADWN